MKRTPVNNFLFLVAGITLLFCATLPDLSSILTSFLRVAMRLFGFGGLAILLIISKVFFILGGTALAGLGVWGVIEESKKQGRQPDWIVIGCVGGGAFFALLSLIPILFWIGIFAVPALVFALLRALKEGMSLFRNPLSKAAALMMIFLLVGFWDRLFNITAGTVNAHIFGCLCGIAAFVGLIIFKGKIAAAFDDNGKSALLLMMIGSICYAVAGFFNLLAVLVFPLGWVGALGTLAGWILYLIAAIKLMNSSVAGRSVKRTGLFMMIGLLASLLPLVGVAAVALIGFSWVCLINELEEA